MTEPALVVDGLVAGYGGGDVLREVSFTVPEGGITCIVGPNGAGKSTLLATISGLLRPRRGTITLRGEPLAGKSPRQVLRMGVVHVPQRHSLFRDMTVRENIGRCSPRYCPGPVRRQAACPEASSGWSSSPAA